MNEKITYWLLKVQSFYKQQFIYSIDIPGWKQWLPNSKHKMQKIKVNYLAEN